MATATASSAVLLAAQTSVADVLNLVAAGSVSAADGAKRIGELTAKSGRAAGELSVKVSAKGALSVYGLQRMPVTLYGQQWERLARFMPKLLEFAKQNDSQLSRK